MFVARPPAPAAGLPAVGSAPGTLRTFQDECRPGIRLLSEIDDSVPAAWVDPDALRHLAEILLERDPGDARRRQDPGALVRCIATSCSGRSAIPARASLPGRSGAPVRSLLLRPPGGTRPGSGLAPRRPNRRAGRRPDRVVVAPGPGDPVPGPPSHACASGADPPADPRRSRIGIKRREHAQDPRPGAPESLGSQGLTDKIFTDGPVLRKSGPSRVQELVASHQGRAQNSGVVAQGRRVRCG